MNRRVVCVSVCVACVLGGCADRVPAMSPDGGDDSSAADGQAVSMDGARPDADARDATTMDAVDVLADVGVIDAPTDTLDAVAIVPADASADGGTIVAPGSIRVANLTPNGAPVDFCLAVTGTPFGAPYMRGAGVTAGLAYGSVSEYAGPGNLAGYTVRIVAAGATGCATPLAGVADLVVPTATLEQQTTVVLLGIAGDATAPLALRAFVDDTRATSPAEGLRLRIVHAAPHQPATDFEFGAGAWTYAVQNAIAYGAASSAGSVATGAPVPDARGYLTSPIDAAQVTARRGTSEIASGYDIAYRTGSAYFVGDGSESAPLGMVQCDDTQPGEGRLSACTLRTGPPTFHKLRFMHLAPDAPAVDACLRLGAIGTYDTAGILARAGIAGGESYLQTSGQIVTFPDWTSFETIFVEAGASCEASINDGSIASSLQSLDGTITLLETAFGALRRFAYVYTVQDFFDAADTDTANFSITNDGVVTGAETIRVFYSPSGGTEHPLIDGDIAPRGGTFFARLAPGTYDLRVADQHTTTTVASSTGLTFAAGATTGLHYYARSATLRSLARCDLAEPPVGSLVTCVQ